MRFKKITVGSKQVIQKKILKEDTALNFGSGALKTLLATPTLAALMIEAAVLLVDSNLPENCITIGKKLDINHEIPTTQGMTVTVSAELVEKKDTKLVFEINAYDELGHIGRGHHERYIVHQEKLMKNVDERCAVIRTRV